MMYNEHPSTRSLNALPRRRSAGILTSPCGGREPPLGLGKRPLFQRPEYDTRHTVPFPSSVTSSAPSCATATLTGLPHTLSCSSTNPVRKSTYSPVGTPFLMRTRTTL